MGSGTVLERVRATGKSVERRVRAAALPATPVTGRARNTAIDMGKRIRVIGIVLISVTGSTDLPSAPGRARLICSSRSSPMGSSD